MRDLLIGGVMLGRAIRRPAILAFLTLSSALAFGCSGASDSGDDDEDGDDENSGGTSGFGGTTARGGGAGVLGGGGSGRTTCLSVCEREQACPNPDAVDCVSDCAEFDQVFADAGCTRENDDYWACRGALADTCSFNGTQCLPQEDALITCFSSGPSCGVGSLPPNPSCSALCPRLAECPDASATCEASCAELEAQADAVGCSAEHQAYMACGSTCSNICVLGEYDCIVEYDNFYYCVIAYCAANPSAAPCL